MSHLVISFFTPDPDNQPPDNPYNPPFPGPQPPSQFPPAVSSPPIPDSDYRLTPVQPDTPVIPTLVVPPHVPEEQMISPEKRPLSSPVSDRPSTKARPTRPVRQLPASSTPPPVPPSNHLGGDDRLVFSPPVVQTPKPKKKKPEDDELPEEEDAGDPDAQQSGQNLPIVDDDGQPVSPESPDAVVVIVDNDIPDDVAVDVEEEEEDDTESDETIDYNDLFVDESSWSWLSAEQKLCSNTGSFTVPRYIECSPVDLKADFVTPSSYMVQKKRQLILTTMPTFRKSILRHYGGRQSLPDLVSIQGR